MNSISEQIKLTDEQIAAAFDKVGMGKIGEDVVAGDWNVELTQDTVDGFAEIWGGQRVDANGNPALVARGIQRRKGEQRRDLIVIDFGSIRAAVLM